MTPDIRILQLKCEVSPRFTRLSLGDAVPARAAAASRWSLLRVSSIASIAIAAFCAVYFSLQLLRGAL